MAVGPRRGSGSRATPRFIGIGALLAGLHSLWEDGLALGPAAIALGYALSLAPGDIALGAAAALGLFALLAGPAVRLCR